MTSPSVPLPPTSLQTSQGTPLRSVGLGCMFYGSVSETAIEAAVAAALDAGVNHFDTANVYESGQSERAVGRALRGHRDRVFLATKGGIRGRCADGTLHIDGRPEGLRAACEESLQRLGVDTIDLYYLHRYDPAVPIEETVGGLAQLVTQGKVRHLGLSEVSADTLVRAHAVHRIAALQSEFSLWTPIAPTILENCARLGTTLVAYSPLGRGYLAGSVRSRDAVTDLHGVVGDRFKEDALHQNATWLAELESYATSLGRTLPSLALGWVLSQGALAIPGSKTPHRVRANAQVTPLRPAEAQQAAAILRGRVSGHRYPGPMLAQLGR